YEGGAIYNTGTATIADSNFSNNSATYGGGAVHNYHGTVTIAGSGFSGNTATTTDGGAIYNDGTATIAGSSFSDNSATSYGGAIYSEAGSTTTIVAGSFASNTAGSQGGAIFNAGTVSISGSSFFNNSASSAGGAIYNTGTATIADSAFASNANGAIYNTGTASISGSSFADNSSTTYGGGAIFNFGTATIVDSRFSDNSAGAGGAIFNEANRTVSITDSSFSGNSATYGGAMFINGTATITGSSFSNNFAAHGGGAIFDSSGTVTIADSSFFGNTTDTLGGAVYTDYGTINLTVSGGQTSIFSGNTASGQASSIYLNGPATLDVSVAPGGVLDMRDPMGGRTNGPLAITQTGAGTWKLGGSNVFTDEGSQTIFNVAAGTLYLYAAGEVSNATATNSSATVAAGAIRLDGSSSSFILGGTATLVAAGSNSITTEGSIVLQSGATFRGGTAADNADLDGGGALAATGGNTSLTLAATGGVTLRGNLNVEAVATADTFSLNAELTDASGSTGSLTKLGAGTVVLTGDNSYTGTTTVAAGTLAVDGSIASSALTIVNAGATLAGTGTVGTTTINSGGILAPGRAGTTGSLAVNGNLTFENGAIYAVDIAGSGSDLTTVSGRATLKGGTVVVSTRDPLVSYQKGQTATILRAGTGVSGTFADSTISSAFLATSLSYDADNAYLTVAPIPSNADGSGNPAIFETVAHTANQYRTAVALDTLAQSGSSLALYNKLLLLDAGEARGAYNVLDGEIHASLKSGLIEDSHFARYAVTGRLLAAFGEPGGSSADNVRKLSDGLAVWGSGYGSWARLGGGGHNAASLDRTAGGFFVGADKLIDDIWRIGVMGGYGRSFYSVDGRTSSADVDQSTIGAYAGARINDLGLHLGVANTWHAIDTSRNVAFPGFAEIDRISYNARTTQIFGDAGYTFHAGGAALEPFAGFAWVNLHTNGYDENGIAGLHGGDETQNVTYSTIGLRGAFPVSLGSVSGNLYGTLGWQHAFGDVTPWTTHALTSSDAFTVTGVPIARDAALIQTGLDIPLSKDATLGFSYTGRLGAHTEENGLSARFRLAF
ncbi:autotransporter domain-containing protein, partial [Bradyrhizobium sp. Leo121]|uniref:autotransporter outer membrane beta-barrel domain-containing protein n=1 Tax=Bradyrhizobium sp. Leo121 TaxID=1571195 RepID=UPI001028BFE4